MWEYTELSSLLHAAETRWTPGSKGKHTSVLKAASATSVCVVFLFFWYQGSLKTTVTSCECCAVSYHHNSSFAHTQDLLKITYLLFLVFPTDMQIT